jgi:cytoskeletal protein CcmA (bactofilin family)
MSFFSNRRQLDETGEIEDEVLPHPAAAAPQPVGFETVLGANCVMEGTLRSQANVRLDGSFSGTLEIEGNVLVGETAKINADINAKNISIAGAVHGNVSGKRVQLLRTGRIWGDIRASALTTEEGAFIDGKIAMVGHAANAPAAETSVAVLIPTLIPTEAPPEPENGDEDLLEET